MQMYIFEGFVKKKSALANQDIPMHEYFIKEIENAKKEWEYALKRFNDVSDPVVVDYIVYYIIAAERRYMYLLNKYKEILKDGNGRILEEVNETFMNKDILNE